MGWKGQAFEAGARFVKEAISGPLPKHAMDLGRKVYGQDFNPSKNVGYFSTVSEPAAATFGRAIDFDPSVREGLDTLINATDVDDNAYMLLDYMESGWKQQDDTLKTLAKTKKNYNLAKQQRKNWNTGMDKLDAAPTASGAKGRADTAYASQLGRQAKPEQTFGLGMQAATKQADPVDYRASSIHSGEGQARRGAMTEVHHGGPLDKLMRLVYNHSSYQGVTPDTPSPLIEMGEKLFGVKIGNNPQNTVDILGWLTQRGRSNRVLALSEQVGDVMHTKTIDDLLGTSDFRPADMPQEGLEQLRGIRSSDPAFKDMSVSEYSEIAKNPVTGKAFKKGGVTTKIEIWDPKANISKNSKDTPLEVIKLTEETYPNRVQLAFDALERHKIKGAKEARVKWDKKLAKVDPRDDILGMDHDHVHDILEEVEKTKGTALYQLAQMSDDEIFNLSTDQAFKLYIGQMQEAETVLANVLQYRYKEVEKLFKELHPNGIKGLGETFDKLGAPAKQRFFRQNVNTLAVRGNVMKDISVKKAMKPVKNWNNHVHDTFGWSPQSLWVTVQEIEELAKEFAQKIKTTQPIPGVE